MESLPKSVAKIIKSLQLKKYRNKEKAFLVQGHKSCMELFQSDYKIRFLVVTEEFLQEKESVLPTDLTTYLASTKVMDSLGTFKSNDSILAVVTQSSENKLQLGDNEWFLVLDEVRDPGNLGTILRTADWFGVRKIVLSQTCADLYNPKVISASMGSFTRMEFCYCDLQSYFRDKEMPLYISSLEGNEIGRSDTWKPGGIVLGNESQGVGEWYEILKHDKLRIPGGHYTESLNVSISAAILLYAMT